MNKELIAAVRAQIAQPEPGTRAFGKSHIALGKPEQDLDLIGGGVVRIDLNTTGTPFLTPKVSAEIEGALAMTVPIVTGIGGELR